MPNTPINRSISNSPVPPAAEAVLEGASTQRSASPAPSRHSMPSEGPLAGLSTQSPRTSVVARTESARSIRPRTSSLSIGEQPARSDTAERPSLHVEPAGDTVVDVAEMSNAPQTRAQAQTAAPSRMAIAHTLGAEFVAKGAASAIHFGATNNFTQYGVSLLLDKVFVANHPNATALIHGTAAAASLAASHALGEVVVRTALLQLGGSKVMEWKAESLFPDDTGAQRHFKALQSASKIGSTVGNAVGLASFCIVQGSRSAMGFSSPGSATLGSAIAGGCMAALHTLIALSTGLETQEGVFEHTHKTEPTKVDETLTAVRKAVNAVVTKDGPGHELFEALHEIVAVRGSGAFLGLVSSLLYKARAEAALDGKDPSAGERFQQTATATFMLLGIFFFSHLGLSSRRGPTPADKRLYHDTRKTFDEVINIEKAIANGSATELASKLGNSSVAKAIVGAAKVADATNHVVSIASTLPVRAALDTLEAGRNTLSKTIEALRDASARPPTAIASDPRADSHSIDLEADGRGTSSGQPEPASRPI